jgi:hypothetical protein
MKSLKTTLLIISSIVLAQAITVEAATYYLCSQSGNDTNDGLSEKTAWKSLERANSVVFEPGDSLLIASGSVFKGQLAPKGSGALQYGKMVPILLDRFGEGALPRIDGEGKVNAPLFLHNVEGWEIQHIELTNKGEERATSRYGVYVLIDAMPVARHFVIRNVTVRDVNGSLPKSRDDIVASAIRLNARTQRDSDQPGLRFEDVTVEGCTILNCARNGIVVSGTGSRRNWNPSTRVVIRRNLLEGVCGDGILVIGCDGALVEWNVMRDCPDFGEKVGAAAGIWPFASDNTVLQFNEVVGHKAWNDGQAYDCDYNCNDTLYQYNLSRDNYGGFMLICSPGRKKKYHSWNRGSVVRYNLSINDGLRTVGHKDYRSPIFHITGETTQDTEVYSNLVIVPKKPDPKMDANLIHFDQWGGKYPVNTSIRDNVFVLLDNQPGTFDFGAAKQVRFKNNRFYGAVEAIRETDEVELHRDTFSVAVPEQVTIAGKRKELQQFALFLKEKGNPQEDAGISIRWEIVQ